MVGMSGALGDGCSVLMPIGRTVPAFTCGSTSVMLSSASWIWPPISAFMISFEAR